jgi:type VII secretion effector (TIGR04197 family)
MGIIGLDKGGFSNVVNNAASAVSDINKLGEPHISKTNLSRFTKLKQLVDESNQVLSSFKNVSAQDTSKMHGVAGNMADFDQEAAHAMQQNTVRFN